MRIFVKDQGTFDEVKRIHDASFSQWESAPTGVLREMFDKSDLFVIGSGESKKLLGFCIVSRKFGEPYVWAIAVDAQSRGLGIGKSLLDEVACFAREYPASGITLTVNVDNVTAQRLYLKEGYRVFKFLPNYYGLGGSGIIMRRKLL